ncbi:oxidoreductase [Parapedobacter tibetensis]|uniref:oxidoreductase n=1 Tax=Parapedobacter tibetensis TaxID=2972951 RepID=UPI00214DCB92|nr:hypothetical protein [Parapedobacter tibetensis]
MSIENHPIFQPIELWQRKLANRMVVAPMTRVSAMANGEVTGEMVNYYMSFAAGGFGGIHHLERAHMAPKNVKL